MDYIIKFDGTDNAFLSNFYPSEIEVDRFPLDEDLGEVKIYPTSEHAFQAAKTHNQKDRDLILLAATPGAAKRMGRQISLRGDWEDVKNEMMLFCLRKKFEAKDLRDKLLGTGDSILVEGNKWHDSHWGVCYCEKCKGVGKNMLGKLLMKVREDYV